jgi:hypothetical protein
MFADVIAPELLSIVILKGNFDINLLINQTSPLLQGLKRCFVFFFPKPQVIYLSVDTG